MVERPVTEASPPEVSSSRRVISTVIRIARVVLLIVVLVAAFVALQRNWRAVQDTLETLTWSAWLPSFLVVPAAMACSTLSWQAFVDEIGEPIGVARGSQIFLVGQLGKYLPGSVWAYVLQLELGRRAGLARARIFAATVFSLAVGVVGALVAGAFALPSLIEANPDLEPLRWPYYLLPVAIICLHPRVLTAAVRVGFKLLHRPNPGHPIRRRVVLKSLAWALLSYALFGLHLWLLVNASTSAGLGTLWLAIGAIALGLLAGLIFFLLPSGVGVREAVIVTALTPSVGPGRAVAFAAVSRVMLTAGDLLMAGGAALLAVVERRRHGAYSGDPGITAEP